MNNKQTFDEWSKSLENMDFDHYSLEIRNKIIEGTELDDISKQCFKDCFDYVTYLYKNNKPLDVKLLKIHLEEVKGYKTIKFTDFVKIILLLNLCGFDLKMT